MYTTDCLVCKNPVTNYPSRKRKFCSFKCSSKIRSELKVIRCAECNNIFKQVSSCQERCGKPEDTTSCSYKNKRRVARDKSLFRRYGITRTEYNNILSKQDYSCAICGQKIRLVLDHCHKTGNVRGILCHKCNTILGMCNDESSTLLSAVNYLKLKSL